MPLNGTTPDADSTRKGKLRLAGDLTGSATTPRVTKMSDANNNELLTTQSVASAVNNVDLKNAATGNAPEIAAVGDDTNINLRGKAKGSGTQQHGRPVAFAARAPGSLTSGAQQTIDAWGTVDFDYGSNFNATTGIFTAPYDGVYHFDGGIQITNTNGRVIVWSTIVGVNFYRSEKQTSSAAADISSELSFNVLLTAGDQVKLDGFQETGATATPATGYFSGFLVGRTD